MGMFRHNYGDIELQLQIFCCYFHVTKLAQCCNKLASVME